MGCEAYIFCIGPKSVLYRWDALAYPSEFYDDVDNWKEVIGHIGSVRTNHASEDLAAVCKVGLWELGRHRIYEIDELAYDNNKEELASSGFSPDDFQRLKALTNNNLVQVWFNPNG